MVGADLDAGKGARALLRAAGQGDRPARGQLGPVRQLPGADFTICGPRTGRLG